MISDYHIHSYFSFDSDENPEKIVKQAINLGMKSICFTDHQDFNWPIPNQDFSIDTDIYFPALLELKKKYKSKIDIKIGAELGLTLNNVQDNLNFIKNNTFDYIIGSCHIIDNMDPYYSHFWKNTNDRDIFEKYFLTLFDSINNFKNINALGHFDYIVRYSPNKSSNYSPMDYKNVIDEILKLIISKDIVLEINTCSLGKILDFTNPHPFILKRYKELGGVLVTVGSDAHKASGVGYKFNVAQELIDRYKFKLFNI